MKVALFTGPQRVEIKEIPQPEPGPGQVRVKMHLVGICGSDVHLFKGEWAHVPLPIRAGHEGIGTIDALGPGVTQFSLGQRVVIEPNYPCGQCRYCWRGLGNICPKKRIVGVNEPGCFAEYFVVPGWFAWSIQNHVSDEDAVLVEPAAVGWHALQTARLKAGNTIAVIGLGAIGLLLTQIALALGFDVLVYDIVPEKSALAREWGARPIDPEADRDVGALMAAQFEAARVVAVFECGGTAIATATALRAVPAGAKVVLVGLAQEPVSFVPADITRRGVQILTSIIYDHPADFDRTLELISKGIIEPSKAISSRFPFSRFKEALSRAMNAGETKVVVSLSS